MNIDETLKENLSKIQKKVNQSFEIITKNGNCYKFVTFKCDSNYCYNLLRQNNITGEFVFENGSHYITTKENLWQDLESNIFYYYDL